MTKLIGMILAAGEGKRMRSDIPKALAPVCGRPMILYLLDSLGSLGLDEIVVVVGRSEVLVAEALRVGWTGLVPVRLARQRRPLGSGDAASAGLRGVEDEAVVIVVAVDTPLLRPETLRQLLDTHRRGDGAATMLVTELDNPFGYGRILRSAAGDVVGMIEERDATESQRAMREVGTSIYCFTVAPLREALARLAPDNAQGELYLTDVIGLLVRAGHRVEAVSAAPEEVMGINDPEQLAAVEALARSLRI